MTFGERLASLRNRTGLSQSELAKRVNISKSALAMYETNNREPNFQITKKLADYFEVSIDYLLCRTDEKNGTSEEINTAFYDYDNLDKFTDEEVLKLQEKIFEELKRRSRNDIRKK